ncbi:Bug family tripartite tricarboxylate transporter substrate binding protein [Variovorax terrae]|uniref:Tripartite tricarboxylate transporter substrate binding protein n=1 Tax=Variovorax terrae TaxID=2923278 RepID=A0A9X2AP40_9BURK|nr:tripartite tricarboxylate transporter substrate binding protein [Variovorax terrae]MCJ0764450.1 tripartite tricarboxylate transporter substrate binding protein [Variovorax terrae]
MFSNLRRHTLACALTVLAGLPLLAQAQGAERDINLVVGYPAGGALDAMARVLGQKLSALRGKPVIIDNRPGFSGNIGAQYVAKAPADGNTLLMAPITSYAMNATLMAGTNGYDLVKDFEPVAISANLPNVMIANQSLPANTLQEFIQLAKAKPGAYSFATTGNGSLEHIAGEMLKREARIDLLPVPYKGSAPGVTDLIGGQINVMFVNVSTALNNLKTGRIKVLAVSNAQRIAALPDVPTFRESGIRLGNDVVSIFGIMAPRGTPRPVVDRLNADLNRVMRDPEVKARFEQQGVDLVIDTPAHAAQVIASQVDVWRKVFRDTGISLQ